VRIGALVAALIVALLSAPPAVAIDPPTIDAAVVPPDEMGPDQPIVIETPGAGGYGDPTTRDPDLVRREAVGGLFSTDYLARHYGFEQAKAAE